MTRLPRQLRRRTASLPGAGAQAHLERKLGGGARRGARSGRGPGGWVKRGDGLAVSLGSAGAQSPRPRGTPRDTKDLGFRGGGRRPRARRLLVSLPAAADSPPRRPQIGPERPLGLGAARGARRAAAARAAVSTARSAPSTAVDRLKWRRFRWPTWILTSWRPSLRRYT